MTDPTQPAAGPETRCLWPEFGCEMAAKYIREGKGGPMTALVAEAESRGAAARDAEVARYREALTRTAFWIDSENPCWCDDIPDAEEPHQSQCLNARAALAAEPVSAVPADPMRAIRVELSKLPSSDLNALDEPRWSHWIETIETVRRLAAEPVRSAAPVTAEGLDVERELRRELWLHHGHEGLYGDDGEMQCARCMPTWDYLRAPLSSVLMAAESARLAAAAQASPAEAGARCDHKLVHPDQPTEQCTQALGHGGPHIWR
jgi:hypothetical protein